MNIKFDKKLIIIIIFCFVVFVIGITYASKPDSIFKNMVGSKISIDEEAYGDNELDTSNLELLPILDKNVEKKKNVIYIDFFVGGAFSNDIDNIVYDIALSDLKIDCNLLSPYVKWKLLKNNIEISSGSLDYQFDTIRNGRLVLTNIQQDLPKFSDECQDEDILKCKNKNTQTNLLNKQIKGKIEIELYAYKKEKLERKPSTTLDLNTCINY